MKKIKKAFSGFLSAVMVCAVCLGFAGALTGSAQASSALSSGPVNPNATQEAKNLLNYLRELSFSEQTLVGAFNFAEIFGNGLSTDARKNHTTYIKNMYGYKTGLVGMYFPQENLDSTKYVFDYTIQQAKKEYSEGKILLIHFDDRWQYILMNRYPNLYVGNQDLFLRNLDSSYAEKDEEGEKMYADFLEIRKQWGDGLEMLQKEGITVMFRPFPEMTNHPATRTYSAEGQAHFRNIWRQTYDYLVNERGINNCLFGFSPLLPVDNKSYIATDDFGYYPGDDVVDVIMPDYYPSGSSGMDQLKARGWDYSKYIATGKPFGFAEFSCGGEDETLPEMVRKSDYGRVIADIKEFMPRMSFLVLWTESVTSPSAVNVEDFLFDDRVVSLSEGSKTKLADYQHGVMPDAGNLKTDSQADFGGGTRQALSYGKYTQADLKRLGFDPAQIKSLRTDGRTAIQFYKEDGCKGESWVFITDIEDVSRYGYDGSKVKSIEVRQIDANQLSLGKPATASAASEDAGLANDGKLTVWEETEKGVGSWLTIDLRAVCLLSRWEVRHAEAAGRLVESNTANFRLQYSLDGKNFKTADAVLGNRYSFTGRDITQIKARYVRLLIDKPNSESEEQYQEYACIADWGVYGLQVSDTVANTDPEPVPTTPTSSGTAAPTVPTADSDPGKHGALGFFGAVR